MKAVFLDRDGVINENRVDHVKCWEEFAILPGVLDALRTLRRAGWLTIVVTNQAIINRRVVARSVVDDIHHRMAQVVRQHGGRIDGVYYCPHRPEEGCECRKPRPGLLRQAAAEFGLQLDRCYLVGDALTDIAAGQAVGCRCALVQTGRGLQQLMSEGVGRLDYYHVAADLSAAVRWLIRMERVRAPRRVSVEVARG